MSYTIVIAAGLVVVFLLFVQLYNETRAQVHQIRKMFDHVVIKVYSAADGGMVATTPYAEEKPLVEYPLMSTSTTCGRDIGLDRFRVDLLVCNDDKKLKETAAEFCIEPYGNELRLYVHPIDQPIVWYGNPKGRKRDAVYCIVKDAAADVETPKPPTIFRGRACEVYTSTDRPAPLQIGDTVLLGDTRFDIRYEGRDAQ